MNPVVFITNLFANKNHSSKNKSEIYAYKSGSITLGQITLWTGVRYYILDTFLDSNNNVLTTGDHWTLIEYAEVDMKNSFNYLINLKVKNSKGTISTITLKAMDKKYRHIIQNFERYVVGPKISTYELLELLDSNFAQLAQKYYSETISKEADGEKFLKIVKESTTSYGIASNRIGTIGNPYEQISADSYILVKELEEKLLDAIRSEIHK